MTRNRFCGFWFCVLLSAALALPSRAQTVSATLSGRVTDVADAAVVGATLELTSTEHQPEDAAVTTDALVRLKSALAVLPVESMV